MTEYTFFDCELSDESNKTIAAKAQKVLDKLWSNQDFIMYRQICHQAVAVKFFSENASYEGEALDFFRRCLRNNDPQKLYDICMYVFGFGMICEDEDNNLVVLAPELAPDYSTLNAKFIFKTIYGDIPVEVKDGSFSFSPLFDTKFENGQFVNKPVADEPFVRSLLESVRIEIPKQAAEFIRLLVQRIIIDCNLAIDKFYLSIIFQALVFPEEIRLAEKLPLKNLIYYFHFMDGVLQHSTGIEITTKVEREIIRAKSKLKKALGQGPTKNSWGTLSGSRDEYKQEYQETLEDYINLDKKKVSNRSVYLGDKNHLSEHGIKKRVAKAKKLDIEE